MNPDRPSRLKICGAVALGIAVLGHPAIAAADVAARLVVIAPEPPATESAPGGTVILRGSGSPKPDAAPPGAERTSISYPSAPPAPPPRFDPNFDTGGIDQNFDRNGLTRP